MKGREREGGEFMRRLLISAAIAVVMAIGVAGPATANPPNAACNGLDKAHDRIHASGTEGEFVLHDLRVVNHCGHEE
jgi:hypothetical protein